VERPQPGGAGCGYTSLFERLVSSTHQSSGQCSRNIGKKHTAVIPSRGTSHKVIDHTNYLRVTLVRCVRSFAALRMTRVIIRSSSHHFLTSFHRTDSFISERRLSLKAEVSVEYCVV
jgi:hypothetical protein